MGADDIQSFYELYPGYLEALQLLTSDGPDVDMEQNRHQARYILTGILTELEANRSNPFWIAICKSAIACINVESGESTIDAEQVVLECIPILDQYSHITCLQLIQCLNSLAISHYNRGDIHTATECLERAETFYRQYTSEGQPARDHQQMDRCNIQTVFLLAQIYSQSSESDKAALYCQKTLQQQVLSRDSTPNFNISEWATNCTKLSAFYLQTNRLRQAMYCIHVSRAMLQSQAGSTGPNPMTETDRFSTADIHCASGEVYSRWLHLSADCYRSDPNMTKTDLCLDSNVEEFVSISIQLPEDFHLAGSLKQAQYIFREGFMHFQSALKVYTLNGFVTDHVVLLQKSSSLLRDLIAFSSDHAHICKLHKRRIDLLESVIDKLNPKIYTSFVRQLLYELAQCYSDMADSKLEQINHEPSPDKASRWKKVNVLTAKSIQYFKQFISSISEYGSSAIDSDFMQNFLKAKFQMARLHSRFLHSDKELHLSALKSSLYEYEEIMNVCRKRPVDGFKDEFQICQEMCSLLPLKIQSILTSSKS